MKNNKKIAILLMLVFLTTLISTSGAVRVKAETTVSGTSEISTYYQYGDLEYKIVNGEVIIVEGSNSAKDVVIPEKINGYPVTKIGSGAFACLENLNSIEIPDSVTSIGAGAFYFCFSLSSIKMSKNVNRIDDYVFCNCIRLSSIVIPDKVTSIGFHAFENCKGIESIEMPNSVKSIGEGAFQCCENLKSIIIPNSVTSIGEGAFEFCQQLNSVEIPSSITSIKDRTFQSCDSLSSIKLSNSVISIGDYAFRFCHSLSSIEIPSGVTSIGGFAFDCCEGLVNIVVDNENTNYSSENGILYNKDKTNLIFCIMQKSGNIEIPSSVKTIEGDAFYNCTDINSIEIPDSITNIGVGAFSGCKNLNNVKIPDSVKTIECSTFAGCSNLINIEIPSSVTTIEEHAFSNCNSELTISGYSGSEAEKYAKDNSIKFKCYLSGIDFDNSNLSLKVGDTKYLTLIYTPTNAEIGIDYTLFSSNEKVVTVDNKGQIKAVSPGTATITAKTENGLVATCNVVVVAPLKIDSFTTNIASPQTVGTAITLSSKLSGGIGQVQTKFTVSDGTTTSTLKEYSTEGQAVWTPTKAGTYTITASAKDSTGKEVTKTLTYVINPIVKNETTIYYKGYAKPNIHYKVGNGSWTKSPGVAMTPTSEISGYTHKITIDLGTATTLTACFNNGSGSWDSKNGANYSFNAGTYEYSNGKITKIDVPVKALTIDNFTANVASPQTVGTAITLSTASSNGTGTVQTKFTVNDGTTASIIKDYSTDGKVVWNPTKAGTYTITTSVKDATGNVVTKTLNYVIKDKITNNQVTIYYKGYSTPYLHYKIGSGSWTKVPGVAMTATTEMAGYTHKITIDLGSATTLTACFTNGSGSWDSKNGANYIFNTGSYTYSNGKSVLIK